MRTNVPIRARKSSSSWEPRWIRPSRRKALARLTHTHRDYRFTASITLFVLSMGFLTGSMISGATDIVGATHRRDQGGYSWYTVKKSDGSSATQQNQQVQPDRSGRDNTDDSSGKKTEAPTAPSKNTAPVAPAAPASPETQTQPVQQQPATTVQPPVPTPRGTQVSRSSVVATAPQEAEGVATAPVVDTAPAIEQMVAAQAEKSADPVSYTTNRISDDTRDRLLISAGVATLASAVMYALTLIGGAASTPMGGAMRRKIPIQEVVTS